MLLSAFQMYKHRGALSYKPAPNLLVCDDPKRENLQGVGRKYLNLYLGFKKSKTISLKPSTIRFFWFWKSTIKNKFGKKKRLFSRPESTWYLVFTDFSYTRSFATVSEDEVDNFTIFYGSLSFHRLDLQRMFFLNFHEILSTLFTHWSLYTKEAGVSSFIAIH